MSVTHLSEPDHPLGGEGRGKSLSAIREYRKQVSVLTNGILDKLDAGGFAFLVQLYADEIYTPVIGQVFMAAHVGKG